jgi:hypothetical protein
MRNVGGRHCPLPLSQYAEIGLHSAIKAAQATTVLTNIKPIVTPETQRRIAVLLTRKMSRHTEALMEANAQKRTIWLVQLYLPMIETASSSRKQTCRPFPCWTPTMLRAFMATTRQAAMRIVQSSLPRVFLRAKSLSPVVMTLGTVSIAAGMRRMFPMLSSVSEGSSHIEGEDMSPTGVRITWIEGRGVGSPGRPSTRRTRRVID